MDNQALVEKYVAIRDYMKAKAEARAEEDKPYVEAMQTIEGVLLAYLNEHREESVRTSAGTFYKSTTMTAKVEDSEALFNFIRESDNFHLLTAAVAKDAVKEYMAEHQDTPPPGVSISWWTKVNVRRA